MNKKLLLTGITLGALAMNQLKAQEYQPFLIQSGFNADVIANGVGTSASSTNNDVDGVNYAFISKDFQLTATDSPLTYGLPVNGIITSAVASTSGLTYQMAPYSSNNTLRLQNANDAGTLVFSSPTPAINLYMLATGGSGQTTVDATVNFADNTTQTFTALNISDWYYGSNYAIQGIGRINITNDVLESSSEDPRLYQLPLSIDAANQSKNIVSITITKISGGVANIFAFSGDVYNPCEPMTNITATTTNTTATVSWTAPANAPSSGYEYYYSTSSTAPTATTTPSGSTAAGTTTATIDNLVTGQSYYFWVRSNCGALKGFWKMKQFTTGQLSATYTSGDISTLYADSDPDNTSTTNCPGNLTINVPAGYKIASTSVTYDMTAQDNAYMSEQRSILVCTTNNTAETDVSIGGGSDEGTYSYERTGLNLANELTGTVNFELRAWRMWDGDGNTDCDTSYNKVDNNSWTVTVTLQPINLSTHEIKAEKKNLLYPNPFNDVLNIKNPEKVKQVIISDIAGRTIKTVTNPNSVIHVGDLKSGLYIARLLMSDGTTDNLKIIKK